MPKKSRKVYDDSFNLITSDTDRISKITEFFDDVFSSDETQISVTPEKMELHSYQRRSRKHRRSLKKQSNRAW